MMHPGNHPLFRSNALQHYLQGREESVLPRFISPPVFACLWILIALLALAMALAGFLKIPVYVPGTAIVARGECPTEAGCKPPAIIVALLPPGSLPRLRVGQTMFLEIEGSRERLRRPVIGVEPAVESPEFIRDKFGIQASLAPSLNHPAAVAIAQWEPGGEAYAGSILHVEIESGSRRILALLRGPTGDQDKHQ